MSIAAIRESVIKSSLDSAGYEAGARRVVDANRAMVASGEQVVAAQEKVTKTKLGGVGAIERLERSMDKTIKARQAYARIEADVATAVARDSALHARGAVILEHYREKLLGVASAATLKRQAEEKAAEAARELAEAQAKAAAALERSRAEFEGLRRSLDAAYRSQVAMADGQQKIAAALARGDIGYTESRALLGVLAAQHAVTAKAAANTAGSTERLQAATQAGAAALSSYGGRLGPVGAMLAALGPAGIAASVAMAAIGTGLVGVARAGDEARGALARLAAATGSIEAARAAYQGLYETSAKTGIAVAEGAGAFVRFRIAAGEIGATNAQVLRLVDGLQKAAIISGTTAAESAAATMQLGQALASGRLNGDELRSLLENMPVLAQQLARELGTNIGHLRKMGQEGQLTADKVFPALLRASEKMSADFDRMPLTMGRAFGILGVEMTRFAESLDEALGVSEAIARAVKAAADAVRGLRQATTPTPEEAADRQVAGAQETLARLRERLQAAEAEIAAYRAAGLTQQQAVDLALPTLPGSAKSIGQEMAEAEAVLRRGLQAQFELRSAAAERENRVSEEAARKAADAFHRGVAEQVKEARQALGVLADEKTTKQIAALEQAVNAGAAAFGLYKITAAEAAGALEGLRAKADPLLRVMQGLRLSTEDAANENHSPLEARVQRAIREANPGGGPMDIATMDSIRAAVEKDERTKNRGVVEQSQRELATAREVLKARQAGNELRAKQIEIDARYAEMVRKTGDEEGAAAWKSAEYAKAGLEVAESQIKKLQPMEEVRRELAEQARASEQLARASALSAQAQVEAAQQDRARAAALKVARDSTEDYRRAYAEFLALIQRDDRAKAAADVNQRVRTLKDEVALMEREIDLVGALPIEREKELAALRIRQELLASGKAYTEEEIVRLEELARQRAVVNQRLEEQNQVLSESKTIANDVARSIYEGLVEKRRGESVVAWFGNLFKRIAIQALANRIFLPITTSIIGAVPQLFGIGGGGAGGGGGTFGGLGDLLGLSSLLPADFSLSGALSSLGSLSLISGNIPTATSAALGAMGGAYGPASAAQLAAAGGYSGMTLGGFMGGAGAGFAAGTFINQLLGGNQTGGMVGSGLGAAAGAAIGSIIPGIGTLIGGLIGGAAGGGLGGLFGPKPSVQGWGFRLQSAGWGPDATPTNAMADGLLPIDRRYYNQSGAQAFAAADQLVASTNAYLQQRGLQVGGTSIVGGNKNGADYSWADAGSLEEAFTRLRFASKDNEDLTRSLQGKTFTGVDKLAEWVEGFIQAQDAIEKLSADPVPAFTQQVEALDKAFADAAATATKYGLATEELNTAHARGLAELQAARAETLRVTAVNLDVRRLRAQGRDQEADLLEFTERAAAEVKAFTKSLEDVAATAAEKGALLVQLEETQAAERAQIVKRWADEANAAMRASAADIRSYVNSLRAGSDGGASPTDRLTAAQSQFGTDLALARGGNKEAYGRITQTADLLLSAASDMYASGPQFQAMRTFIMQSLESLPAVKSYDAEILDALSQLGGGVNVAVELEVVRVITEQLNALPDSLKAKLVQAQTVVRDVQERIGRFLTAAEVGALVQSQVILRDVWQSMQRDLSPAERAGLVAGAVILRDIRQQMGADLSAAQRAGLVQGATVLRAIEQGMQRDLSVAERSGLVQGATVLRGIEQSIGRALTAAEQASILYDADVSREIQQAMARDLSPAERAGLVQSQTVLRAIEQGFGRNLSVAERASLVQATQVLWTIEQGFGRNLSIAERDSLIQSSEVLWTIEQSIGRNLTPEEAASLVEGEEVARIIEQSLGRQLTAAERAGLVQAGSVMRSVEQQLGRALTEAEKATIVQGGAVLRGVYQQIQEPTGADLLVPSGLEAALRGIYQQIMAATGANLLEPDTITRIIRQAVETTETVEISRSIDFKLTSIMNSMIELLNIIKSDVATANGSLDTLMARTDAGEGGGFGGGDISGGSLGGGGGLEAALGAVLYGGNVVPFARGGLPSVVDRPSLAPMALFGEAGPEAIMPLDRDGSGRLGVRAAGGVFSALVTEMRGLRQEVAALRRDNEDLQAAVRQGAALTAGEARAAGERVADRVDGVRSQLVRMDAA